MRRFLKQFMADLKWRYNHWVCSVEGHSMHPPKAAVDLVAWAKRRVCSNCGDHIEELDPVRRARAERKARESLQRAYRLAQREAK